MRLARKVRLRDALRYRGQGPMWAFILHRLSGIGLVFFVGLHVLAAYFTSQAWGIDAGILINAVYEHGLFQAFIFFCALFHAINGLRIVVMDLRPALLEYQREAIWMEWAIFLPTYGLALFIILRDSLGGAG